ncbi:MAG: hypothetical protein ACKO0M_02215 [Cyanobium sp.]
MASPQGQRALALEGDPNSPWQDVLTMIQELRRPLIEGSHMMLNARAQALGYAEDLGEDLEAALEELSRPLYNVTQADD